MRTEGPEVRVVIMRTQNSLDILHGDAQNVLLDGRQGAASSGQGSWLPGIMVVWGEADGREDLPSKNE